jgi:hypothetical protein
MIRTSAVPVPLKPPLRMTNNRPVASGAQAMPVAATFEMLLE